MISVLLPTRGRPQQLQESVESLLYLADHSERVEVLCAIDPDDQDSRRKCLELHEAGVSAWTAPERFGYGGLHHYCNFLAGQAAGARLMIWNDDARMLTEGWDTIVEDQDPLAVLWPRCNHAEAGNMFPIWPKAWYELLGYVSLVPNIDVWVSEVGRRLGIEVPIPVEIRHERADVTGQNDDLTYAEGRALMGNGNHHTYDNSANRVERARVVRLLGGIVR